MHNSSLIRDKKEKIYVKNIHLHEYVMILITNCSVELYHNNEYMFIPRGSLFILEKRLVIDIMIIREADGNLYDVVRIDNDTLKQLKKIYDPLLGVDINKLLLKRALSNRVFFIKDGYLEVELFRLIRQTSHGNNVVFAVAFLFSRVLNRESILNSLIVTAVARFSEKVSGIILGDIKRKWRLVDVADALNLSEITVRKKLESEYTTFYSILMEIRMSSAFKMLVYDGLHVNCVSNRLGFSSTSYFIKTFREYYGLTPKQLIIGFRDINYNSR
ncbi:helix-turn-helix domain-containing protein [Escherichia coli]|uniref:helix-turn-helix domain-containing protein n=1 Tax=Escherichia coli TaxID=562 RepID=UPI0005313825|nr:helix-turn-helix domain-containing protein [Escherichia coli]EFD3068163.1 helix-turn-helix domain-containing protein [Escherichia coli]KGT10718.1 AraC family transcriptional regulator [Escherichia coli]